MFSEQFIDYLKLMRLHKPIGIFLLLWPTLWALWIAAGGIPSAQILFVFVAGTVLMRSAGCAINDFADRDFDPQVARTRERPIAAGRVAPEAAVRLFVAVSLIAFGLLTSLKNVLAIGLSIPAALLAASYPFTKRWISLPQAVLGIAFSWGIPMAWAAVQHAVNWPEALMLMTINFCWVMAYDTWYALVDIADDRKAGVKSSAILFGQHAKLIIALLNATALVLLLQLGIQHGFGVGYDTGIAVASACAAYQQWIARDGKPEHCFRAFLANNYFGAAVFLGFVAQYWR